MTSDRLIPGNRAHEQIALVALVQAGTLPMSHLAGMVEQVGSAVRLLEGAHSSKFGAGDQPALFDIVPEEAREKAAREVASWKTRLYHVALVLDDSYPHQLRGTVAVFGTGLRSVFPKANASLARDIVRADGALVSQFLPTQHAAKWTFPTRNITMSGLSVATVVVEAGETSGARMQARVALEHGRAVFLLQSLVDEHEWARVMVDRGIGNVRARILRTSGDLVDGLSPDAELPELAPA